MAESTSLRRAKRPRTAIAGPYGHPFHPILVTIPIGAWIASLVFDIVSRVGDDPQVFAKGAYWRQPYGPGSAPMVMRKR